jgi:hypothetical protein
MKPKLKLTTITANYAVGSYVDYQRVVELPDGRRVRVVLHSDASYPVQSKAHVDLWTEKGWAVAHQPHPLSMREVWEAASPYVRDQAAVRSRIETTADALLAVGIDIIGPKP